MRNLILLPGWTRNGKSYDTLLHTAPADVHVEVFDYSLVFAKDKNPDLFQAIANIVDQKHYARFTLAGHSLGGAFAIELASKFPAMIDRLYLIDSEGVYMQANLPSQFYTMLHNHSLHGHKKLLTNYHSLLRIVRRPNLYYRLAKIGYNADVLSEAQALKMPTTILWGSKDLVTTVAQGKILSQHIPNSTLKVFDGLDHDWLLHQPEKFWTELSND